MPAEWEPHEATWIAWPHNREDWPGRFAPIPWVYGEIVRKLAPRRARAHPGRGSRGRGAGARASCRKCGADLGRGGVFPRVPRTASGRAISARIFVRKRAGEVAITNWRFNGWAKYDNWQAGRCRAGLARDAGLETAGDGGPAWCSKAAASTSTARRCC